MPNFIRVLFVGHYPSVNPNCSRLPSLHVTQGCPWPGLAVEILTLLTGYLNLAIDVSNDSFNSNISYAFNAVYNNETDLYAGFVIQTKLRAERFDFTRELFLTYTKIAVRQTEHSLQNILDFFSVYEWDAWLSMISVFILFTSFGLLVRHIEFELELHKKRGSMTEVFWKMLRFQLVQTERIEYRLLAGQSALLIFSIFQVCIILGLFQGFILSSVVRKTNLAPFTSNDDFAQMIKSGKFFVVTSSLSDWFYQEIETSYVSPFFELRQALKSNPYRLAETDDEVLETVNKGEGAVTLLQENSAMLFNAERYCNIVYVKSPLPPARARLMFRKDSPFVELFNRAIKANGPEIEKIKHKYLEHRSPSKCALQKDGPRALTIAPYFGLLILYAFGILLGLFVLGGEVLKWRVFDTSESKNDLLPRTSPTVSTFAVPNEQTILPNAEQNLVSLANVDAKLVANFVKTAGLPSNTKLYALTPKNESNM